MKDKDIERYLRLKYPMEIVEAEEGGYFAHLPDLPGCMAQGETIEEVVKDLAAAKRAWIEVRLEDDLEVPEPHEVVEDYSGRFVLRVPKSLHRELAKHARREGTSLNQYVLHLLSVALGKAEQPIRSEERIQLKDLLMPQASLAFIRNLEYLGNLEYLERLFGATSAFSVQSGTTFQVEFGTTSTGATSIFTEQEEWEKDKPAITGKQRPLVLWYPSRAKRE